MSPKHISQGYPLYLAYATDYNRGNNPSTENGRWSLADHAARSDQEITDSIDVVPVIGWLLTTETFEPAALTPRGYLEADSFAGLIIRFSVDPEKARTDLWDVLIRLRNNARRRCDTHNIKRTVL
jgi:hypothetical protein